MHSWEPRFWAKVQKTDGCWLWIPKPDVSGYGRFRLNGKILYAHRVALVLAGVPLPEGLYGCHGCNNKICVRVGDGHLRADTQSENIREWHQTRWKPPSPLLELPL